MDVLNALLRKVTIIRVDKEEGAATEVFYICLSLIHLFSLRAWIAGGRLDRSAGLKIGAATVASRASKASVNRTYDLFELMPNGEVLWVCAVTGLEAARRQLSALGKRDGNEYLLMHVLTSEIVERVPSRGGTRR